MNKKLLLTLILALLALSLCFAGGTVEGHGSGQLHHATVNNDNQFWDISEATNNSVAPTAVFSSVPSDGIGVFRIRANNDIAGTATITAIGDNWNFIHENNYTLQRPYELEAYKITFTRNGRDDAFVASSPVKMNLTRIGDQYSFTMEAGEFKKNQILFIWRDDYCVKYYEYEFRLVLPPNTDTSMEPGDYFANISVNIPYGETYSERNIVNYRLKGRFGESSADNAPYSFMVQSNEETYNFNLLDYTYRSIADVSFYASGESSSERITTAERNKYKVYLSPFPNLDDDSASAKYYFIKYDTENQPRTNLNTVYYEVAKDSRGNKWEKKDNAHPNTYVIPLNIDKDKIVGKNRWSVTWKFEGGDEIGIYIKPLSNSGITPSSGLYYTNLYFFVESN